ncbi:MAG TPA: Swt1 family HEPN domain-containing protein, partial [Coriobacteriia bacterium]|nr:Swt1 family HEPN domain-containing protein [Coriobacteriia bacterium]
EVMRRKDALAGRRERVYSERDLSLLLRSMTERLGELGYPFDRSISRQAQNYASELRDVRNRWAHNEEFTAQSAFRALDSTELLLREIGATTQADEIASAKVGLLPAPASAELSVSDTPARTEDAPSEVGATPEVPRTQGDGGRISISALPVLSFAMAHCKIAVVDEISVERRGSELRGASLELDITCAEGSLGGPKVLLLDLVEGQRTTLRGVDLVLDPARMLRIDEQQPGEIRALLRSPSGEVVAQETLGVQILAPSQWIARPQQLGMEMLAAHVQPNSAAIAPLLLDVSDRLRVSTGNSALDGYQSESPDRVDAIAAALYDAMCARDIRYAEPPATWGLAGQKVRTPNEVLEGRLGTCLDTTVTYAAALEQVGINSTLWLLEGHSFVGFWRADSSLGAVTSVDVAEVVNLVDLGLIGLVETTMLTGGQDAAPFDTARRAAKSKLTGDLSKVLGITDIRQARESQIYPLPSRSVGADGEIVVSVYESRA